MPSFVFLLVAGPPGSGKTTLAGPLAKRLDLPLFAKDTIKEALWQRWGPLQRSRRVDALVARLLR